VTKNPLHDGRSFLRNEQIFHSEPQLKFDRLRFFAIIAIAALLSACSTFPISTTNAKQVAGPTPVKNLLWIGNSFFYYNNSMHGHVGRLLTAGGGKGFRSTSATISGSGLNWHDIDAHFRPGGVASYSFVANNEVRFNSFDKPFDAVMMMDCSQCPIHPKLGALFHETARKHSATVRSHGAEPVLFMSWAYANKPEMTESLAREYQKAGADNNALVVPAGLAFAASKTARPDLVLTVADKRHPSLMGTYLGACVVLASVYKQNPIGNKYSAGLAPDVVRHLQTVAWETVKKFEASHGRGSL
jgi:hypothetical protein